MEKIIFWDWTGTLADESQLDKAVCQSIEEGIAHNKKISYKQAQQIFRNYLKALENRWEWHDYVRHSRHFGLDWKEIQIKNLNKLKILPYVREILIYCENKGYKNVLATNAVQAVIHLRINQAGLLDLFEGIIASDEVKALKAEGKHFEYGLKIYNGDPQLSFSIGDNPVQDILSAQKLNLKTVYCDLGQNLTHYHSDHIYWNHKQAVSADFCIKNLLEIKKII